MTGLPVATAPVSWGIDEFRGRSAAIGWSQVLDEMAASGYRGTELGPHGFLPTEPDRLREALERRGLALVGAYVPVPSPRTGPAGLARRRALRVGRLLRAAGAELILLADDAGKDPRRVARAGRIRPEDGLDPEGWRGLLDRLQEIARLLRQELGLTVAFHHHCAGLVETPQETERLLEGTDLDLCLDTGHWLYGGGDPTQAVGRYGERIRHVHLKDVSAGVLERVRGSGLDYFAAVGEGAFCPLGEGLVDLPGVLAALDRSGYRGWLVVEQDLPRAEPGLALELARRNREQLRRWGV